MTPLAHALITAALWLVLAALVIGVVGALQHRRRKPRPRPKLSNEHITIRLKGDKP